MRAAFTLLSVHGRIKVQKARPDGNSFNQRSCYSGQKRFHCLAYWTITTPDGLLFHLYGPIAGRHSDAYMYRESEMDYYLRDHIFVHATQYYLYSDQAYVFRPRMQVAFPGFNALAHHDAFNKSMKRIELLLR